MYLLLCYSFSSLLSNLLSNLLCYLLSRPLEREREGSLNDVGIEMTSLDVGPRWKVPCGRSC